MNKHQINDVEKQMWIDITAEIMNQMEADLADRDGHTYDEFDHGESAEVKMEARLSAEVDMMHKDFQVSLEQLQDAADARGEPGPLDVKPVTVEAVEMPRSWRGTDFYEEVLTNVIAPDGKQRSVDMADTVLLVERFADEFDWEDCNRILGLIQPKLDELEAEDDLWNKANGEAPEEADQDYFEILKGVKDAAIAYNHEVAQAASKHGIEVTTEVLSLGMIKVAKAKVELAI